MPKLAAPLMLGALPLTLPLPKAWAMVSIVGAGAALMFIMLIVDGAPLLLMLSLDCTRTGNPPSPCGAVLPGGKYSEFLSEAVALL